MQGWQRWLIRNVKKQKAVYFIEEYGNTVWRWSDKIWSVRRRFKIEKRSGVQGLSNSGKLIKIWKCDGIGGMFVMEKENMKKDEQLRLALIINMWLLKASARSKVWLEMCKNW